MSNLKNDCVWLHTFLPPRSVVQCIASLPHTWEIQALIPRQKETWPSRPHTTPWMTLKNPMKDIFKKFTWPSSLLSSSHSPEVCSCCDTFYIHLCNAYDSRRVIFLTLPFYSAGMSVVRNNLFPNLTIDLWCVSVESSGIALLYPHAHISYFQSLS